MRSLADQVLSVNSEERIARARGLRVDTVRAAGLRWADASEVAKLLGMRGVPCGGIIIRYPHAEGFVRVRLDEPWQAPGWDKPARYLSPPGAGNRLYIPPNLPPATLEGTGPLVITEGEFKALRACEAGLPCVATAGIWSWKQRAPDGTKQDDDDGLLPDLRGIAWAGRSVVLVYDSDITPDHPGYEAYVRLAAVLVRRGASSVRVVTLPSLRGHEKVGLDDYLNAGFTPADFWGLVDAAPDFGAVLGLPLSDLLERVKTFITMYVVLPSEDAITAVTLWVAHCWVFDCFETTAYLLVQSPEKRAGKTRLLEVLEALVPRPWRVVQPSEAVLFRKISADQPTLLLDEADAIWGMRDERTEPLRAVLNAGFRRGARVPRCVQRGKTFALQEFGVWCPKAIASIGAAPDTITDRGVVIRMDRASPEEQRRIKRLRLREAWEEAAPLRAALARWSQEAAPLLRAARPNIPEILDGRAADAWEPLLAMADLAGGPWPTMARQAAIALSSGPARAEDSLGIRLLRDIRQVFEGKRVDRLPTAELIEALAEDEETPWGDWGGRGRISPHALARLLKRFGITPSRWREGAQVVRGYDKDAFAGVWARYLPVEPAQVAQSNTGGPSSCFGKWHRPPPL